MLNIHSSKQKRDSIIITAPLLQRKAQLRNLKLIEQIIYFEYFDERLTQSIQILNCFLLG